MSDLLYTDDGLPERGEYEEEEMGLDGGGAAGVEGDGGVGFSLLPPDDPVEEGEPALQHVIMLRGLPWNIGKAEVREFLTGVTVEANGIVLEYGPRGLGYVSVATAEDAAAAVKLHRTTIAKRYIEVTHSSAAEFDKARRELAPLDGTSRTVVKVSGLPADATKGALRALFDGYDLAATADAREVAAELIAAGLTVHVRAEAAEEGGSLVPTSAGLVGCGPHARLTDNVYLGLKNDGRLSGEAYVAFASHSEAVRALSSGAGKDFRGRPLMQALTTRGEVYAQVIMADKHFLSTDGDYAGVLRVRGLPFTATYDTVVDLFASYSLDSPAAVLLRKADGRPAGEGFAFFSSEEEARRAAEGLAGTSMASRTLDLVPCLKAEAYVASGGAHNVHMDGGDRTVLLLKSAPYNISPDDVATFLGPHFPGPNTVYIGYLFHMGRAAGDIYILYPSPEAATAAAEAFDKATMNGRTLAASVIRKADFYLAVQRPPQVYGAVDRETVTSVLHVKGMPYDVTEKDVADFFDGFSPGKVHLVSVGGRGTGEGYVEFTSPAAAFAAMSRQRAVASTGRYFELFFTSRKEMKAALSAGNRGMGGPRGPPPPPHGGGGGGFGAGFHHDGYPGMSGPGRGDYWPRGGYGGGGPAYDGPRGGPAYDGPRGGPAYDGPRGGPGYDGPRGGPGYDGPRGGPGYDGPRGGPAYDGPRGGDWHGSSNGYGSGGGYGGGRGGGDWYEPPRAPAREFEGDRYRGGPGGGDRGEWYGPPGPRGGPAYDGPRGGGWGPAPGYGGGGGYGGPGGRPGGGPSGEFGGPWGGHSGGGGPPPFRGGGGGYGGR